MGINFQNNFEAIDKPVFRKTLSYSFVELTKHRV